MILNLFFTLIITCFVSMSAYGETIKTQIDDVSYSEVVAIMTLEGTFIYSQKHNDDPSEIQYVLLTEKKYKRSVMIEFERVDDVEIGSINWIIKLTLSDGNVLLVQDSIVNNSRQQSSYGNKSSLNEDNSLSDSVNKNSDQGVEAKRIKDAEDAKQRIIKSVNNSFFSNAMPLEKRKIELFVRAIEKDKANMFAAVLKSSDDEMYSKYKKFIFDKFSATGYNFKETVENCIANIGEDYHAAELLMLMVMSRSFVDELYSEGQITEDSKIYLTAFLPK